MTIEIERRSSMSDRKGSGGALWIVLGVMACVVGSSSLTAVAQETIKLLEKKAVVCPATGADVCISGLVAPVPRPWQVVPVQTRNLVELVLPAKPKPGAPEKARVQITTETRSDHAAALRRLQEIQAEREGQINHVAVCGWPALKRRSVEL